MQKLWLVFAQSVTICLGVLFVATLFKHDLLPNRAALGTFHEVVRESSAPPAGSFRDAARKAMPSVVNIFTSKEVRSRHPSIFPDNPELRRFF